MPQEDYEIRIVESGGARVQRKLSDIGRAGDRSARQVGNLTRALGVLGAIDLVQRFTRVLDTMTLMENRLKLVTSSTTQLNTVMNRLQGIAFKTRVPLEATVETFFRMSQATRELGKSQQETLNFVEALNNAVSLSGAHAKESTAGLFQLSQGLSSTALRGDELRSVLEQIPVVADVIAAHFNTTRGGLYELGTARSVTGARVLEAFRLAAESLERRFGKTTRTIEQSVQVLSDRFIIWVSNLDKALGLSQRISGAVLAIGDNIDVVARTATAFAGAFGLIVLIKSLSFLTSALIFLLGPLRLLALATSFMVVFADQTTIASGSLATFLDVGRAIGESLLPIFGMLKDLLIGLVPDDIFEGLEGIDVFRGIARGFDLVFALFRNLPEVAILSYIALDAAAADAGQRWARSLTQPLLDGINKISTGFLNLFGTDASRDILGDLQLVLPEVDTTRADEAIAALDARLLDIGLNASPIAENYVNGILDRAEEIARERIARARTTDAATLEERQPAVSKVSPLVANQTILALQRENEVLQANTEFREILSTILDAEVDAKRMLTQTEGQLVTNLVTENMALMDQAEIFDAIRGPIMEVERSLLALDVIFAQGLITLDEYNRAFRELHEELSSLDDTAFGGLLNGLQRVANESANIGQIVSDSIVSAFGAAEDAIIEFAKGGEFNIRRLFSVIAEELARLAINQLFGQIAGFALGTAGGAGGGGSGFLGGLLGFQRGGSFDVGGSGGPDSQVVAFPSFSWRTC